MSIKIIQERLDFYNCRSTIEEEHALREISQEVVLAALSRTDFFKLAAFQGGTCLRIFYSLNRFSEDLDFILKKPDRTFSLNPYCTRIANELTAFGYDIEIVDRSRVDEIVKKAFLKDDSVGQVLQLRHLSTGCKIRKIKIKLEVDSEPPSGSKFELKYHDFPFAFSSTLQDFPSLFAGKIHALLCRKYIKGRDWYDFIWYTSRRVKINFPFLGAALKQVGPWAGQPLDVDLQWTLASLKEKIGSIEWNRAANDVKRFVVPKELPSIEIWSSAFFLDRLEKYASSYKSS